MSDKFIHLYMMIGFWFWGFLAGLIPVDRSKGLRWIAENVLLMVIGVLLWPLVMVYGLWYRHYGT